MKSALIVLILGLSFDGLAYKAECPKVDSCLNDPSQVYKVRDSNGISLCHPLPDSYCLPISKTSKVDPAPFIGKKVGVVAKAINTKRKVVCKRAPCPPIDVKMIEVSEMWVCKDPQGTTCKK